MDEPYFQFLDSAGHLHQLLIGQSGLTYRDNVEGSFVTRWTVTQLSSNQGAKTYFDSKVLTISNNNQVLLYTKSQFEAIVGHSFEHGRDIVLAMCGDSSANNLQRMGTSFDTKTGNIGLYFSNTVSGSIRVEVCIICKN